MPLVNFSNVDFDQIKESIKDYLRANSNFTDYDFEGSNLSAIIDTLAYNTYISSYNANMITNDKLVPKVKTESKHNDLFESEETEEDEIYDDKS